MNIMMVVQKGYSRKKWVINVIITPIKLEWCKQLCSKVVTWMIALEYYLAIHLALLRISYVILCDIHTIPTFTNGHTLLTVV